MPKEAKESFEDSLKIVKQIITEKKSQIAADSEGKLVGRLLPEVQGPGLHIRTAIIASFTDILSFNPNKGLEELVPEIDEKITEATKMNEDYVKMKATLASAFGFGNSRQGSLSWYRLHS